MDLFSCEEENGKRYLSYRNAGGQRWNLLEKEMVLNNEIPNTVPMDITSENDSILIKYDITGLVNLSQYLSGTVGKQKILSVAEQIMDTLVIAEEYLLNYASYILDPSYIFVDPQSENIFMIVFPLDHNTETPDMFLRRLLANVQYDQKQDCSYVVTLINFLSGDKEMSVSDIRKKISEIRERHKVKQEEETEKKILPVFKPDNMNGIKQNIEKRDVCKLKYVLHRIKTNESFEIKEKMTRIGRSPSVCEICLLGNRGIGRIHAILHINNGKVYIEDNSSKNKTYVNDIQISPGAPLKELQSGSRIRLGDEELEFIICSYR